MKCVLVVAGIPLGVSQIETEGPELGGQVHGGFQPLTDLPCKVVQHRGGLLHVHGGVVLGGNIEGASGEVEVSLGGIHQGGKQFTVYFLRVHFAPSDVQNGSTNCMSRVETRIKRVDRPVWAHGEDAGLSLNRESRREWKLGLSAADVKGRRAVGPAGPGFFASPQIVTQQSRQQKAAADAGPGRLSHRSLEFRLFEQAKECVGRTAARRPPESRFRRR